MSLFSTFFNRPQQTQIIRTVGFQTATLSLDATVKESFTGKAEPTKHPVEAGADITDHVIIRPLGLSVSGVVTNTPFEGLTGLFKAAGATVGAAVGSQLGKFAPAQKALGGATSAVGGAAGALGGAGVASLAASLFGGGNRLSTVVLELQEIRDALEPVDIQTGLKLYESFILVSFSVSRDDKTGGSIKVDLEFEELIQVESSFSDFAIPKIKGALSGKNGGRKTTLDPTGGEASAGSSVLKKIF